MLLHANGWLDNTGPSLMQVFIEQAQGTKITLLILVSGPLL